MTSSAFGPISRTLFLLVIIVVAACAADLPQDAQSLLNSESLKETALKAKFDADIAALRKELVPKLQKAQEAATKKGDLDGAMAIKAKLAELDPSSGKSDPSAPVTIVAAAYGLDQKTGKDVTAMVTGWLKDGSKKRVGNEAFGFDPAPNAHKQLYLSLIDNRTGAHYSKSLDEGDDIAYEKIAK